MDKIKIYLAGGWFSPKQDEILTALETELLIAGNLHVHSPRKVDKLETGEKFTKDVRQRVFLGNLKAIDNCDLIIASTEGKDMGTIFESGYAFAKGKPIVYVFIAPEGTNFNLMLSESGKSVIMSIDKFKLFVEELSKDGLACLSNYEYNGVIE